MIRNFFKVALRNLQRNKMYTVLNVLGLSIGIAASLLILMVIRFETSFDNFHKDSDRIYRLATAGQREDGMVYWGGVPFPVVKALRNDFPQLENVGAIFKRGTTIVTVGNAGDPQRKKFNETEVYLAEPSFFEMFNFTWLAGTPQKSLTEPNTVVLTRETAEKYFGDWKSAINKDIRLDNSETYKVTGILNDLPVNTDFPLKVITSYASIVNTSVSGNLNDWVSIYYHAYVFAKLPQNMKVSKFNADLVAFTKKYKPAEYAKDVLMTRPLKEMHFEKDFGNFNDRTFSRQLILTMTLISIFLIVIACVNFINLSTAQAVKRSKEVGVRKVMGSNRWQLGIQFISETAIITLTAMVLAVVFASITLPFINQMLGVKMSIDMVPVPQMILFILGITTAVTILSGLYPALIVAGFNPITALKNKISAKSVGNISLRRALVILQFSIAHILIIATLIVISQTDFFRTASLGFEKAAILNVPVPEDSASRSKLDYLRAEFLRNPDIQDASFSFASPSDNSNWNSDFRYDHAEKATDFAANLKWADVEYFNLYKLNFIAGRPYASSDTVREFVVNETLLKNLGITDPNKVIGKQIDFWKGRVVANICGVVRDFNSFSLREPMAPVIMASWKNVYRMASLRLAPGKERSSISYIEKIWNKAFPDYVFSYEFLDKKLDSFYKQENQLSVLYRLFAAIAIFISCLGLYGLVSFMAVQRVKEVGIRKVLGASVSNIIYLFSREFTLLILIAFAIAAPIAWLLMNKWLQDFTYRIPLGAGFFIFAVFGSLIVAWITVGYRSLRAATINPVKSLQSE